MEIAFLVVLLYLVGVIIASISAMEIDVKLYSLGSVKNRRFLFILAALSWIDVAANCSILFDLWIFKIIYNKHKHDN